MNTVSYQPYHLSMMELLHLLTCTYLLIHEHGFFLTLSIDDGTAAFVDLCIFVEGLMYVHVC